MPSFEQDHQYLLEFANVFEPMSQYLFDLIFLTINSIFNLCYTGLSQVGTVTLGCFTNGTIAQVVTNSLSPLSGQHLYHGSRATV